MWVANLDNLTFTEAKPQCRSNESSMQCKEFSNVISLKMLLSEDHRLLKLAQSLRSHCAVFRTGFPSPANPNFKQVISEKRFIGSHSVLILAQSLRNFLDRVWFLGKRPCHQLRRRWIGRLNYCTYGSLWVAYEYGHVTSALCEHQGGLYSIHPM